jgi:hypothetical protein
MNSKKTVVGDSDATVCSALIVSRNDLKQLCEAILDDFAEWCPTGPKGSTEMNCRFCGGKHWDDRDLIDHDMDCPVLVARDCNPHA